MAATLPAFRRADAPPAVAAKSPIPIVILTAKLEDVVRRGLYSDGYKMPPVDRNKPTRAKSSDSRVSFMEFVREYPDDAACLEHLWRTRYAEDGEHAMCPKCEKVRSFKRYATAKRRQSWTCTACG